MVRGASGDEWGKIIEGKGTIGLQAAVPKRPHTLTLRNTVCVQWSALTPNKQHQYSNTGWAYSLSLITNIYYKKTTVRGIQIIFFLNVTQEAFLQHISTLQHVLLLLHAERLIDNQFLSKCSPTCLQLLWQNRLLLLPFKFVISGTGVENTLSLTYRHKRNWRGVISGDRGGQGVGPSFPVHLFGNVTSKNQMLQ